MKSDEEKNLDFASYVAMVRLVVEMNSGLDADLETLEQNLSEAYEAQAVVLDPTDERLFILHERFKTEHDSVLGEANALAARIRVDELGVRVDKVLVMPDGGTWLIPHFQKYFPEAQFPVISKQPIDGVEVAVLQSLTYTVRTSEGERMPVEIYVERFTPGQGVVLVAEDVLATGESMQLHVDGLEQAKLVHDNLVVFGAVSMDRQKGIYRLGDDPRVMDAYAPVRVNRVTGVGIGKIITVCGGA